MSHIAGIALGYLCTLRTSPVVSYSSSSCTRAHPTPLVPHLQRGLVLSESEAAQVMCAVLDVIHECHTHHHSYGDVKPAK